VRTLQVHNRHRVRGGEDEGRRARRRRALYEPCYRAAAAYESLLAIYERCVC
jgi:hypothetical protein